MYVCMHLCTCVCVYVCVYTHFHVQKVCASPMSKSVLVSQAYFRVMTHSVVTCLTLGSHAPPPFPPVHTPSSQQAHNAHRCALRANSYFESRRSHCMLTTHSNKARSAPRGTHHSHARTHATCPTCNCMRAYQKS